MSVTCENADRGGRLHGSRPRTGGSRHPLRASR
jgi:hypothetical protein